MGKLYDQLMEDVRFVEGLNACMNCGMCTGVCPAAEFYDYEDKYVSGVTVCYQAPVHEHNGRKFGFRHPVHWVFYAFPAAKSDPFGSLCDEGCGHKNVTDEKDIIR